MVLVSRVSFFVPVFADRKWRLWLLRYGSFLVRVNSAMETRKAANTKEWQDKMEVRRCHGAAHAPCRQTDADLSIQL